MSQENFVDESSDKDNSEHEVKIWWHINANMSRNFYYVYQDWYWTSELSPTKHSKKRNYSFLGIYRKYSEADI